jgi:hypothetical protein
MSIGTKELMIKMVISAWESYFQRVNKLFENLSDEQLQKQVAPGRNTGTYLLGHLVAVTDGMLPLLGFGEKLYPGLDKIFLESPDAAGLTMPSIPELRIYWKNVNNKLSENMNAMSADDWFARHNAVSQEDFTKEPHRNKLNIIINRTNHQSWHYGQLLFLQPGTGQADS